MKPRVAVTGGRNYRDADLVWASLDAVLKVAGPFELVHGGARGADSHADAWARDRLIQRDVHKPDWANLGRAAGVLRNETMAASGIDLLVAFPGGRGTADMVRRCLDRGIPVWDALPR